MCPVWLLVVVVMGVVRGTYGECWDQPPCQDLSSETNMLECIQLCHSDLTAETPIFPGDAHLEPPAPLDSDPLAPLALSPLSSSALSPSGALTSPLDTHAPLQTKRSYSMEHFRWGKPVGRKRRPVKVYTSNGVEEESAEVFPGEMRRDLGNEAVAEDAEVGVGVGADAGGLYSFQEKKDGSYKMNHFRWSSPPQSKRYGGFMKSWDERTQKPLLTLFKNVINKDGQQ